MKRISDDPFDLAGQKGENITVDVQAQGTAHLVSYSLNGQGGTLPQGQPLSFSLINPATFLYISFNFTNPQGGVYSIRVTGSAGGDNFGIYPEAVS